MGFENTLDFSRQKKKKNHKIVCCHFLHVNFFFKTVWWILNCLEINRLLFFFSSLTKSSNGRISCENNVILLKAKERCNNQQNCCAPLWKSIHFFFFDFKNLKGKIQLCKSDWKMKWNFFDLIRFFKKLKATKIRVFHKHLEFQIFQNRIGISI